MIILGSKDDPKLASKDAFEGDSTIQISRFSLLTHPSDGQKTHELPIIFNINGTT